MNALTAWLEKYILPVAGKIGAQKHLVALRDAFIGTMPATMAGSVALMINAIIRDMPRQFFPPTYNADMTQVLSGYDGTMIPVIKDIIGINGFVYNGTILIAAIIFSFSWGYYIARAYNVNDLAGGIVSLISFAAGFSDSFSGSWAMELPSSAVDAINTANAGLVATADGITGSAYGWLNISHLKGESYFTAMIIGFVATMIFCQLMKRNITIKLPDSVPPAVSKAFAAIIPATAALYVCSAFYYFFRMFTDQLFTDWISEAIAKPLLGFSQGYFAVFIVTLFVQVFWFFGIHGPNVLAPILEGVFGVAQLENLSLFQDGGIELVKSEGYKWVRGSWDAFGWYGGSGGTIILILAIILFSKRADYRAVGTLSLGPGLFNINEPIMFGLPIVLNAIMFIPFLLAPVVSVSIGYFATMADLVNPVSQQVTWVMPPVLLAFMATGFDWRAIIVSLVCMLSSFIIWVPFVIAANKVDPALGEKE
ncbi:PTS sugar transporter subunit IIC [Enterococcus sp. LJL128]|uniref:PTS sugar transporter subunit IIC n=1 Tax=Enterococcus sp. LJL51 TaxID=3416656 RepID=UPI003CE9C892